MLQQGDVKRQERVVAGLLGSKRFQSLSADVAEPFQRRSAVDGGQLPLFDGETGGLFHQSADGGTGE